MSMPAVLSICGTPMATTPKMITELGFVYELSHGVGGLRLRLRYGEGYGHETLRTAETNAIAARLGVHDPKIYPDLARPDDYKAVSEQ